MTGQDALTAEDRDLLLASWQRFLELEVCVVADKYKDALIPKDTLHNLLRGMADFRLPGGWVRKELGGSALDYTTTELPLRSASKGVAGYRRSALHHRKRDR